MADNQWDSEQWDPEVAGSPELLSVDGDAPTSRSASPFTDLTAEMQAPQLPRSPEPPQSPQLQAPQQLPSPQPQQLPQPQQSPRSQQLPQPPVTQTRAVAAAPEQSMGQQAPTTPPSVSGAGWSPLGATPATPPVRTAPEAGATRYLPPVAPPSNVPTGPATQVPVVQAEPKARRGSRWGWRALVSFIAGGLIAASGFGAAQLAPANGSDVDGVSLDAGATTDATAAETPTTTVPRPARDSGTVPLVPPDVDEPASFVAVTLGPAVVQIETTFGLGSGVIFDDGLILTNNHVVQDASSVRVKLADGRVLSGEVMGSDEKTDVAVVSVGPGLELPIAQLATGQKASVGQIAIAIGSPFDLQQSVTAGIVSAVDRPIQNIEGSVVAMIQTDAPINPGNSGGALADRQGRVIGINTSIQTDGTGNTNVGVGFAIPIDTALRIADLLIAGEPIQPGFLGVRGAEPEGGEAGVELIEVTPDSAAEGAGLLVGDRVLSLNGAPVTGFFELAGLVVANQAGDTVTLELIRDGELVTIDVVLGVNDG